MRTRILEWLLLIFLMIWIVIGVLSLGLTAYRYLYS